MLKDGEYPRSTDPDGFPSRLREAMDSYGSTSAFARAINRSEGAVRKWLRGQSEPSVTDLRAICEITGSNVEWLVFGRGSRTGDIGRQELPIDNALPPVDFDLMDEVMLAVKLEPNIAGKPITPAQCSSIIVLVYNMSRIARHVDAQSAQRIAALPGELRRDG
jgi:transcriptional regulator with XRE-family HTH domain